jgi:hypothetical protein
MDRECGTHGGEENGYRFWGNPKERHHLEDLNVNKRIILK